MPQGELAFVASKGGQVQPGRLGGLNDLQTSAQHGDLFNAAVLGRLFSACTVLGGVVLSAGLATTYTGLLLSNPAGSGVNLSLVNIGGGQLVAPTTITSFGLLAGTSALTGPTTTPVRSNIVGASAAAAKGVALTAATLGAAPAFVRWLANDSIATSAVSLNTDFKGGLIIPPGAFVAVGGNIASPAVGMVLSMVWEEMPIPA